MSVDKFFRKLLSIAVGALLLLIVVNALPAIAEYQAKKAGDEMRAIVEEIVYPEKNNAR